MSAFIIEKQQYMKVAGFLAYYMTHMQPGNATLINTGKTRTQIYKEFNELYLNNVESVDDCYKEHNIVDENKYYEEFGQAYEDAKAIHNDEMAEKQMFGRLSNWFDMVDYQSCCSQETEKRFNDLSKYY